MLRPVRTWWNFRQAVIRASRADSTRVAGDKDVVVVPCWRRPEFLWHCLDNLTRAAGIGSVHVLFRPDTGSSPDNLEVIQSFADRLSSFEVQAADPCPFRRTKPSANFLLGLLHAAATSKQLVFLVEEDIMVGRDFFRWHRAVHVAAGPLFCSIPVKNPNRMLTLPDEPEAYYLSSGDSCSNGMCFDKHVLQSLTHARALSGTCRASWRSCGRPRRRALAEGLAWPRPRVAELAQSEEGALICYPARAG